MTPNPRQLEESASEPETPAAGPTYWPRCPTRSRSASSWNPPARSIGAICAYLGLPTGASTATTSSTTQLFRAVRDGRVTATARPLHRGRTLLVIQTDLVDSHSRPVAHVTRTQAVLT